MKRRGSGPKPTKQLDTVSIRYSEDHWALLGKLREEAADLLEALSSWKESAVVHGSVARGDVDQQSDVDILVPGQVSTQLVEARLEATGFTVVAREIAQATPVHSPKAHLFLDPEQKRSITIPLLPLRRLELEFYRFGGAASWQDIREKTRRPGCTKKLTLIEPTSDGHVESSVLDRESEVARLLGISVDIVRERVRVLTRRDSIGRTGVFLKLPVPEGFSFEEALKTEAEVNPALRRTLKARRLG